MSAFRLGSRCLSKKDRYVGGERPIYGQGVCGITRGDGGRGTARSGGGSMIPREGGSGGAGGRETATSGKGAGVFRRTGSRTSVSLLACCDCMQAGIPARPIKANASTAAPPPCANGAAIEKTESGLVGRSLVKNCFGLLNNLFQNSALCPSSPRVCTHSLGDDISILHRVHKRERNRAWT